MGGTGAEAAIWGRSIEGSLSFPPESSKFAIFLLLGLLSFFPKKDRKMARKKYLKSTKYLTISLKYCKYLRSTGCPKEKHFLNCRFSKLGLRVNGLALPGKQPTGSGRPFTLKPGSANGNSERAFFGTPCIV